MSFTASTPARNRLILLVVWVVFYASFTLFIPPLLDDADSVHAEVAREILLRHDWVTLYANGIRYLEKAPLLYWSIAASFRLFGVSTAAARLPLSIAALALALTAEGFARRAFASVRAGLYAGAILLSSFGIFIFTHITIPDVAVCLWLTLALYAFWLTEQQPDFVTPSLLLCFTFAACCALNVLTKGLIGIVFPVAIVLMHLLLTRGFRGTLRRIAQLHPLSSVLVFVVFAAPWHILAGLANPTQGHPASVAYLHGHWIVPLPTNGNVHGWFWFYFVNEHLLRYLNLRVPHDYDTVPLGLFYGLIFAWLIPWSAYLIPAALRASFQRNRANLLLILWAAIPLLFFSLSTRQEYYVLPALPALILLIAAWLASEKPKSRIGLACSAAMLLLGTIVAAAMLFFFLRTTAPPPGTDVAELLSRNPADYALSFGHILDLNVAALGMFHPSLILTALTFFFGPLANFVLRLKGRPHHANIALATATLGLLIAAHIALQTFTPVLSSEPLAHTIAPILAPGDLLVIHGEYESGSTLGFYLRRNDIHIWDGRSSNLWYGSFFADAPRIFESDRTMLDRWRDPQRIFVWQDTNDKARPLPQLPGAIFVIAESGGKQILSNQPNH
jgi:4-amino-4-deoxy-L-arabinose transferase-like glycosyltransferase